MREKDCKTGPRPGTYALVRWPESQRYDGRGGCVPVDPLSGRDSLHGGLDAALLVPERILGRGEGESFLRLPFPDSQRYEDQGGTLRGYDGALFVPVCR